MNINTSTSDEENIEYSRLASKVIESFDRKTKLRIKSAITGLTDKPPKGDIKKLKGYTDERFRLRKGGIRIIYKFITKKTDIDHKEIIYIMDVGVRGGIYK